MLWSHYIDSVHKEEARLGQVAQIAFKAPKVVIIVRHVQFTGWANRRDRSEQVQSLAR